MIVEACGFYSERDSARPLSNDYKNVQASYMKGISTFNIDISRHWTLAALMQPLAVSDGINADTVKGIWGAMKASITI